MASEHIGQPLPVDANKYSRGVVTVIAGSKDYPGAAVLCVAGARRGGAGYVHHVSPVEAVRMLVLQRFPDVVSSAQVFDQIRQHTQAFVIGPGTRPSDPWLEPMLTECLISPVPVVIDAGALDLLAQNANLVGHIRARSAVTIITPHEGEAARLGVDCSDRISAANTLARNTGAVVILKGAGTVIAAKPDACVVDSTAGPELATAGTGDVLAGLLGSMLAAAHATTPAVCFPVAAEAVRVHGRAGRAASGKVASVTALDVAEELGSVMRGLLS